MSQKNKVKQDLTIWNDKIENSKECVQHFKATMEFSNSDSNADKMEIYDSVRQRLSEIYKDEPEVSLVHLLLTTSFLRYSKRVY